MNGGTRVDSGIDTNGDGQLEDSEMTATTYVCNPTALVCQAGFHLCGENGAALTCSDDILLSARGSVKGAFSDERADLRVEVFPVGTRG